MLKVHALAFDYEEKALLKDIHFELKSGQLLHLRGENGSGKTTLLKLLVGLLSPYQGEIYFKQELIYKNLPKYQQQLCYVGHKLGLNSSLTLKENCLFDMHWNRKPLSLEHMLNQLSLEGLADEKVHFLSTGQKRRAALLRVLMTTACLWLLDEPFVALDKKAMNYLMRCFEEHLARDGAIILTSHQELPMSTIPIIHFSL